MFKICELWTMILWYELNPRVRCAFAMFNLISVHDLTFPCFSRSRSTCRWSLTRCSGTPFGSEAACSLPRWDSVLINSSVFHLDLFILLLFANCTKYRFYNIELGDQRNWMSHPSWITDLWHEIWKGPSIFQEISLPDHHYFSETKTFFFYRYAWMSYSWDLFQPEFYQVCHTKAQYDEYGPSICRHNPVFGTMTWAPLLSTKTTLVVLGTEIPLVILPT